MTLVLDAGGVSALAVDRARLDALRRRGRWPALVPSVVLTELLTGDHRRDVAANRLLRTCQVRPVGQEVSREAARLRTATGRAGTISAVEAIVAAVAVAEAGVLRDTIVVTSDPHDLRALTAHADVPITVLGV